MSDAPANSNSITPPKTAIVRPQVNPPSSTGTVQNATVMPPQQPNAPSMPQGVALALSSIGAQSASTNLQQFAVAPQPANIQALAQSLQANSGGGNIIVLNVGNGNNLAATLSQLVSQSSLQAQALALASAASQKSVPDTPATTAVTTEVNNTSALTTPTATSMNIQPNVQALPPAQQGDRSQMVWPVQLPQQRQEAAAFMLVPIPQMQAPQVQQNQQPGICYPQQHPAIFNIQNQPQGQAQVQQQTQAVNLFNLQQQQQQQQQQLLQMQSSPASANLVAKNLDQLVQQYPKSDELRSYLMQSQASTSAITPTVSNTAMPCQSPLTTESRTALTNLSKKSNSMAAEPHITSNQSLAISNPVIIHKNQPSTPSYAIASQTSSISEASVPKTHASPSPATGSINISQEMHPQTIHSPHQPTVSSPGLAFLAQVSSLTSVNHHMSSHLLNDPSQASSTVAQSIHSLISSEGNSHLPVLPLDDVKANAPVTEDVCTPGGSMTVSSTTKLGDDGLSSVLSDGDGNGNKSIAVISEIESPDDHNLGAMLKRKKDVPLPHVVREKKKKGPAPKLTGNEVCLICSDRASGFHYNTLSCEGCKGFFRRTVIKGAKYQCKQNGDCTMDVYMRRKCQKCRFEKCKAAGMKEENVLSEEKLKAKKLKKEMENTTVPSRGVDDTSTPKLTAQQRSLLELLKANERRFQWPTTEDVKKVTVWVEGDDNPHSRALRFAHFTEMCILIVQLVVEFTKQLPGFLSVLREDQIVLLKACAIEVMLLRAAKQYNKQDGSINFLDGKFYTKSSFYKAGMQVEFVDPIFQFCNSMAQLDLDEAEYAMLVAINTFSTDRPHIKDIGKVECMQDPYVELLRLYIQIRRPDDPLMFARILMKIVELRTLNNYHSEQIFALKVRDQKLPPLLAEIWDM